MSDDLSNLVDSATGGGIAGEHAPRKTRPMRVAPSAKDEKNTHKEPLEVVACWRMDDIRFHFDSSIITPDAADELKLLAVLRKRYPKAPLSVFGHADPVGQDPYNKTLSGRRAKAVYALLTRNTDMWEDLYSNAEGTNDKWGNQAITIMKGKVGDSSTTTPDKAGRAALFLSYMDAICKDLDGQPFKLKKEDFLGKGADPAGKGDLQGCSEFNPVLMFSKEENKKYEKDPDKTERNEENAPNRRVVIFLFKCGTRIDLNKWPCPTTKQDISKCVKRFWSDHKKRREFQEERRLYEKTKDTFACRFYDRLADGSSCEGATKLVSMKLYFQRFPGSAGTDEERGIAEAPYKLRVIGIADKEGKTEKDGSVKIVMPAGAAAVLEIFGTAYDLSILDSIEALDTIEGTRRRLDMLGYHPDGVDSAIGLLADHAILQFQADNSLDPDGDAELEAGRSTKIATSIQDKLKAQIGE